MTGIIDAYDSSIQLKLHTLKLILLVVAGVHPFDNWGGHIGRLKAQTPTIVCLRMHM